MKKKNFNGLQLKKEAISNFSNSNAVRGGIEQSERRTNCDQCPPAPACFSHNGAASCGWICSGSPFYTHTWSSPAQK